MKIALFEISSEKILWKQGNHLKIMNTQDIGDKTNKTTAPSEDSDQPWHLPSLIRAFTVHPVGS